MIKKQTIRNKWIRTYSDAGFFIAEQTEPETLYVEAVDPIDIERTYIETDTPIPPEPEEEEDSEQ